MLPINLLPNYIFDKNKKRNAFIVYGIAIAAVAGVFIFMSNGIQQQLNVAKADLEDATTKKGTYDARDQDIKKVQAQIADIKTRETFVANAQTYNDAWPATYDLMRNITSPEILLKSMALGGDHKTMQIAAFAPGDPNTEAEFRIARWWKSLAGRTNLIEHVDMQVPGHPYVGAGTTTANGGGGGMAMGMPGSMGAPMMSGSMMGGKMGGSGMPSPMGMAGSAGMGMPGSGGMAGGPGGAAGAVGPSEIEGKPGVNFTATVVLKTPLAPSVPAAPVWPAGGGGAAPGGPMGMPGSMGMGSSAGMAGATGGTPSSAGRPGGRE